jgi:hypothetical protein
LCYLQGAFFEGEIDASLGEAFTAILTVGIDEQSPGLGFLCFSVSVGNTINFWQNRLHAFHREVIKIWENMSHSTH